MERNRNKFTEANKKFYNEKTINSFNTINMFYDVYDLKKSELNYVKKGIKYVKAVMRPEFDVKIPLEIIFKILHATEINPFNITPLLDKKIFTDFMLTKFQQMGVKYLILKKRRYLSL